MTKNLLAENKFCNRYEKLRSWSDPDNNGFRIELYDTETNDRFERKVLAYEFFHEDKLIFRNNKYKCGRYEDIGSDETIANIIKVLCCHPDDLPLTESDCKVIYNKTQLKFIENHGEELSSYVEELEMQYCS